MRHVERLQRVLFKSSCIKQRFDLFLLITAVMDKTMQENLTLVVSWNVGENQVMQWAGVDCKPLGSHTERVRCSINNFLRIFWLFIFISTSNYYSHSIICKCSVYFILKCADKKPQIWVPWGKSERQSKKSNNIWITCYFFGVCMVGSGGQFPTEGWAV